MKKRDNMTYVNTEIADKYQEFFDFMNQEHNLILTIEEMDEIVFEVQRLLNKMNKKLLENYEKAVLDIIEDFCKKQDLDFEYWMGDCVGEVACFGDILFNFDDIVHDLKNDAPKGLIIDWYFEQLDNEHTRINYRSYLMGARFDK